MINYIKTKGQKGYTLAELAISTSILAMLAVGGLSIMGKKNEADNLKETYAKLDKIEATLESFIRVNRFVPCPAGPLLPSTDTSFGYSVAYNNRFDDANSNGIEDDVEAGDQPDFQECNNDANDDGDGNDVAEGELNIGGTNNNILRNFTGAVPVRTLGLPDDYMYDGWDRKFTYRISKAAGNPDDFDVATFNGDLGVMDRRGIHKTDINNLPPNNNGAIYVIISHGSNGGNVAWGKNTTVEPIAQAAGVEGQNTSHDSKNYIQSPKTETFDDIVEFGLRKDVIQPFIVKSPVDVSPLTCENAAELLGEGRDSLDDLANDTTAELADRIFENALILSTLCDSAPTEIKVPSSYRGLVLWLDADDENSVHDVTGCNSTADDGERVACWQDKSDNSNNATGSGGPIFDTVESGGGMNQRNVLIVNNNSLRITNNPSLNTIQNSTFFFVGDVSNQADSVILTKRNQTGSILHYQYGLTGVEGQQFFTGGNEFLSNNQVPIDRPVIYSWESSLSQPVSFYQDGELVSESNANLPAGLVANNRNVVLFQRPGNALRLDGRVGEIALYNTTLSSVERSAIEVYLSDKWSIDLNSSGSGLCPPGMDFIKDQEHPEGACQCIVDNNLLVQELTAGSACLFGQNKFNDCEEINDTAPVYNNPPTSSGQALWLDANDCTTITLDDAVGSVSSWADKSPNSFTAVQTATARMPTYNLNTINGLDTINFDASSRERLILGDGSANEYIFGGADGINVFAIASSRNAGTGTGVRGYVLDFGNMENRGYGISFIRNQIDPYITGANMPFIDYIRKNEDEFAILQMNVDFETNGFFKMIIDGTELKSGRSDSDGLNLNSGSINSNRTRINSRGPVTIGGTSATANQNNSWHDGHVGEIIIYDQKLTTTESNNIESYLSEKWGINRTPTDVDNLELWLDASDLNTVYSDDTCTTRANATNPVLCWDDKAKDNDATATSNGPTLDPNAITVDTDIPTNPDIMPALFFDGSTSRLTITNDTDLDDDSNISLFVTYGVPNSSGSPERQYIISKSNNAITQYAVYKMKGSGNRHYFEHSDDETEGPQNGSMTFRLHSTVVSNTGDINSYFEGSQTATTGSITPSGSAGVDIYLGDDHNNNSDNKITGHIGEILFFSNALTDEEREYIELYLGAKWGVDIN